MGKPVSNKTKWTARILGVLAGITAGALYSRHVWRKQAYKFIAEDQRRALLICGGSAETAQEAYNNMYAKAEAMSDSELREEVKRCEYNLEMDKEVAERGNGYVVVVANEGGTN